MELNFVIIALLFALYIFVVMQVERRVIYEPAELLEKFLAFMLLYAGISLVYFALTGRPFPNESESTYKIYIFLIGFIAMMWSIPNILGEFKFFRKYMKDKNIKSSTKKSKKKKK